LDEGVSIIIPTWKGGDIFKKNLKALSNQKYNGDKQIIIIDSGSTDGTCEAAIEAGAELKKINQKIFHHSRTRNEAVSLTRYPYVILLVQDAIPISVEWLNNLVRAITYYDVVGVYGQQVPHIDADLYAKFEVDYHSEYLGREPTIQVIDSLDEFNRLSYDEALRRVRFDNVCAIYKRDHLVRTPFPNVPFGEDMAWAIEALKQGYKVMYQPNIKVHHSHNRSPEYRFSRAIIDTIVCSELLGKVRNDLSHLNAEDLYIVSSQIKNLVDKTYLDIHQQYRRRKKISVSREYHHKFLSRMPLVKRIFWALHGMFRKIDFRTALDFGMKQSFENHLRYIIEIILTKYPEADVEGLCSVIDQVASSMQGGLFGEVYASYKLKGPVPYEIQELISPHLRGV